MSVPEKHEAVFAQLVLMFHAATMQHMGKLKDPVSGKVERNLDAAQATIDVLEMLQARTKGNLSDAESRMLGNILTELRLNFVEEKNKPATDGTETKQEQPS